MKYKLLNESINQGGHTLYRIEAVKDFADVKAGDKGGFVESEANLSQEGNAWIYDNAKAYEDALVYGKAKVKNEAEIYGEAEVYDNAVVKGKARAFDNAWIYGTARIRNGSYGGGVNIKGYDKEGCLTFVSEEPFSIRVAEKGWNGVLEYSINQKAWTTWEGEELKAINNGNEYILQFRGYDNTIITGEYTSRWQIQGERVECHGNIETLLDYMTVKEGKHPVMERYCYCSMFYNCGSLVSAPELPATELAEECYTAMFRDCSSLLEAPELPAKTLANDCYRNMFFGCTKLEIAPSLPSTTLAEWCYNGMFNACIRLKAAPELPATELAKGCYTSMFRGCSNLLEAPELPATLLAEWCYDGMFAYSISLETAPSLPATSLAEGCYSYMFYGCSSLKFSKEKTKNYNIEYHIGSGVNSEASYIKDMFGRTGGPKKGTPKLGTTYYLHKNCRAV